MNTDKLKAKDLITTAVFTVIFTLVIFVCSMVFGMVVVLYPFLMSFVGIIGGVIWAYMRVKTPKPFSITIQCVVTGLLGFLVGTHWLMSIGCVVGGVIADLITSAGKYRNFRLTAIGYAAFCLCVHVGGFLLVFVARDYYYNYFITNGMDVAWSDAFFDYMSLPLMVGTGALAMVCAIVGMLIGKMLLKKHFEKAGMV